MPSGARLIRIAPDAQGLDPAQLPTSSARARLAYVTPCHQFPSGVIMPLERRLALLDWAARTDAWVIEDDYVSEFRYEGRPLEALQALDRHGRVIYIGTFAKTLFPALRLAYLVLPRSLVRPFIAAKWVADRFSTPLPQAALAEFITSGAVRAPPAARRPAQRGAPAHADRVRCSSTWATASRSPARTPACTWWCGSTFASAADLDALIDARRGRLASGCIRWRPTTRHRQPRAGLLFGYASLSEAEIRAGIRKLAPLLTEATQGAGRPPAGAAIHAFGHTGLHCCTAAPRLRLSLRGRLPKCLRCAQRSAPVLARSALPAGANTAAAEQLYAVLSATNEAILRATSATELYQRVCDAATGSGLIIIAAVLCPTTPGCCASPPAAARRSCDAGISIDASRPEGRGLAGTAFQTPGLRQHRPVGRSADPALARRAGRERGALRRRRAAGAQSDANRWPVVVLLAAAAARSTMRPCAWSSVWSRTCRSRSGNFEREAERTRLSESCSAFALRSTCRATPST